MYIDLDKIIFGEYTLRHLFLMGGGVLIFLIFFKIIGSLFKKKKLDTHLQIARCKNCGWEGKVSRYAGRCPQCAEAIGDQKSKRR